MSTHPDLPVEFLRRLDALGVPIVRLPGDRHTERWQKATTDQNAAQVTAWRPGDALMGVMGHGTAVVDVDTKNGADVEATRSALERAGVKIGAEVRTPSGGAHFYVAGHADLPTVHASKGRDGLDGLPGVEVLSHGTNAYLPGSHRRKYPGQHYEVVRDDLDVLTGDDGTALLRWVTENRARSPQKVTWTPGPVHAGPPPEGREAAYLEATMRNVTDRLADVPSGRNTALFEAAMCLGNYVAGAGLDEKSARNALMDACERNGYLAKDGQHEAERTLRSGLDIGKRNPRPVPTAHEHVTLPGDGKSQHRGGVGSTGGVDRVTLDQCHAVFRRWLGAEYDLDSLDAVLVAAAVQELDGDPLWLLVVSGSGNAKTETVQSLGAAGATITSTISSEGALLSATSKRERAKDSTGGLLRSIGGGTGSGVMVVKDVTSILSMNREVRAQVLGALREVYDGTWSRNVGTDGGRTLEWEGRITTIGAVTTAWDTHHSVVASMGDRFVLVRVDSTEGRRAAGRRAIGNTGREATMRTELGDAVAGVLAGMSREVPDATEDETDQLLAAADLVTLARTGVERDYRGDVIDCHAPEMPTRFAKQLAQIIRGGVAIGMNRSQAMRLAIRCARDSVPPLRLAIIDQVAAHPGSDTASIRRRMDKPRATVDRELQALHMLGVLTRDEAEVEHAGRPGVRWFYELADGIDPSVLTLPGSPNPVPEKSLHHPTPPRREEKVPSPQGGTDTSGTELDQPRIPTDISGTESSCPRCGGPIHADRARAGFDCLDCYDAKKEPA